MHLMEYWYGYRKKRIIRYKRESAESVRNLVSPKIKPVGFRFWLQEPSVELNSAFCICMLLQ